MPSKGAERTGERKEAIGGGPYRVPYILGHGPGLPLEAKGFRLPQRWEDALKELGTLSAPQRLQEYLDMSRKRYDLAPGELFFDQNGMLTKIQMAGNQTLALDETPGLAHEGKYTFKDVRDLKSAIFLMHMFTRFIDSFGEKARWPLVPYIDINENRSGYHSGNLTLPEGVVAIDKEVISFEAGEQFVFRANNIAGRFGFDLRSIVYDRRGVLNSVSVSSSMGSFASYDLTRDVSGYHYTATHVDNCWQAGALHAIVAEYINRILIKGNR